MSHETKTFYAKEVERIAEQDSLQQYHYVLIRQSRAYVEANFAEKIEVANMAAAASMSRFYFIKLFKRIYGITPRQHLRAVRIAKAKELLKSGQSVTETCFAVGYDSLPTFSAAFKRGTGYSPKQYQKIRHNNLE